MVAHASTLLSLLSIIIIVVHSTIAPQEESSETKYYRFIYNDGKTHTLSHNCSSAIKEEDGGYSSYYSTILVTNNNTTLIMVQDSPSNVTTPLTTIIAPNKSNSNDDTNNLNTNNNWPAIQLSNGGIFQGQAGIIIGSLGVLPWVLQQQQQGEVVDEDDINIQKNYDNDVNGGNAIEMYNGQSSSVTGSIAYFFHGMTVIGGSGHRGGTALYVHGFGTTAYIYGGIFQGGQQQDSFINSSSASISSCCSTGLSIQVMNGATVHVHSGIFIGDIEIGDSATIIFYGCFIYNISTSILSGQFATNKKNYEYEEDEKRPFVEIKITVLNKNNGKVVVLPVPEQECDSETITSNPTNQLNDSNSSSSRGGKRWILQLLFRFVVKTLIFLLNYI